MLVCGLEEGVVSGEKGFFMSYHRHASWCTCLLVIVTSVSGLQAAPSVSFENNVPNTIAGVVSNSILADGAGDDWATAVLRVDLSQGSVYNDPGFDSNAQQSVLWGLVPAVEFDTWVGIPGDSTGGIAGGAGDLGGGPLTMQGSQVSVTWFNTATTDTGPIRIANISLTDDAMGTWSYISGFNGNAGATFLQGSGVIINGGLSVIPEPASMALLGVASLAMLRRRTHKHA
jgi:PEP-CTERM motif